MLKNMLISSQDKREGSVLSVEDKPDYPYGLRLRIDKESVERLGLDKAPEIGGKFKVMAVAEVVSVEKNQGRGDESSFSFELQIQDLELIGESRDEKVSSKLYGDNY